MKPLIITDIIFEHAVHTQGGQFPVWLSYLPTPFQKKTGETTTITQNMQNMKQLMKFVKGNKSQKRKTKDYSRTKLI